MAETKEIIIPVKTKGVDEANKEVDSLTDSLDDQGESLTDLAGDYKIFGISVNSVSSALKKSTTAIGKTLKSLGLMKVALAGLGIGLAIVALASFAAALKTSKRLADDMSDAGAFLSGVIDQLTADFGNFFFAVKGGEEARNSFTDFLGSVLLTMQQTIPFMKDYLTELILIGVASADANKATREFTEELAKQQLEIAKVDLALELVVGQTRKLGITGAEAFLLIGDTLVLLNDKIALTAKLLDEEEAALTKTRDKFREDSQERVDAEIDLFEFLIRRANTERQLFAQRRELFNRETEAFNRASLERKGTTDDELEAFEAAIVKEAEESAELTRRLIELDDEQTAAFIANAEKVSDAKVALAIEDSQARIQLEKDAANAALSILAGVAEFSKEGAIAAAFVNLGLAIAKVFGQTGVFGFAAVPAVIAAIGSAIGTIRAAKIPATPTFAGGGWIRGELHSGPNGGTHILAQDGEYMINRRAMQDKGIADIAQALNNYGQSKGFHFQDGGFIGSRGQISFAEMDNLLSRIDRSVLVTEDLNVVQNRIRVTEERATL